MSVIPSSRLLQQTLAIFAVLFTFGTPSPAQNAASPPQLVKLVGLDVTAADGTNTFSPEQLCQLSVHVSNSSERPVFSLGFEVSVGGKALTVYEKQLFMVAVPPTAEGTPFKLDLFNFWTSDSQRSIPNNGKLDVEVRLVEAQWLAISEETEPIPGSGSTGTDQAAKTRVVEVWTPAGNVEGLPSTRTKTLTVAVP